jgi:hypothetical protein
MSRALFTVFYNLSLAASLLDGFGQYFGVFSSGKEEVYHKINFCKLQILCSTNEKTKICVNDIQKM